ncbi:hypothetical protein V6C42_07050 [Pseudoclostridium thermosuccinogenes]|uniref:hypothetical protein n=1 Tax=Clostridium thermosuccinogenes TaxID=84032 RepID=UPI002FDB3614
MRRIAALSLAAVLALTAAGCSFKDDIANNGSAGKSITGESSPGETSNKGKSGSAAETGNAGGSNTSVSENTGKESNESEYSAAVKPSLAGISLGDSKEQVMEVLGKDYKETYYEEPGHFPETYYHWEYEKGISVYVGKDSSEVLEIRATSPEAETNLGVKVGDAAKTVFETYRPKYIEPESIHGGKLIGWFKVEGGAAMAFNFDIDDGMTNPVEIKDDDKVKEIILTYPAHVDDSF